MAKQELEKENNELLSRNEQLLDRVAEKDNENEALLQEKQKLTCDVEENIGKVKEMEQKLELLESKMAALNEEGEKLRHEIELKNDENEQMEIQISELSEEKMANDQNLLEMKQRLLEMEKMSQGLTDELKSHEEKFGEIALENGHLKAEVATLKEDIAMKNDEIAQVHHENAEMKEKMATNHEQLARQSCVEAEFSQLKEAYELLVHEHDEAKVNHEKVNAELQELIWLRDAFENEEKKEAELSSKLSAEERRNAALAGHRNPKQRIQYLMKISQELKTWRERAITAENNEVKMKSQIEGLKVEMEKNKGRRRFDPSKAFQHTTHHEEDRENVNTTQTKSLNKTTTLNKSTFNKTYVK